MEPTFIKIDWNTVLPVLAASLGPALTGILRQFNEKWSKTAPWWAKGLISTGISAMIGLVGAWAASGDVMLGLAGGVTLGAIGATNITLRKGVGEAMRDSLSKNS